MTFDPSVSLSVMPFHQVLSFTTELSIKIWTGRDHFIYVFSSTYKPPTVNHFKIKIIVNYRQQFDQKLLSLQCLL